VGLCTLNQGFTKADLLDFLWLDAVARNVLDAICRPDELMDLH